MTNHSSLGNLATTIILKRKSPKDSFDSYADQKVLEYIKQSLREAFP